MATPIKGNGATVAVHDGTSFNTIGAVTDFSLSISQNAIEYKSLDSNFSQYLAGTKGGSLNISFYYDPDDTDHNELTEDMIASSIGSTDQIQITLTDGTPTTLTFNVVITDFSVNVANDDMITGSISASVSGQVTKA